MSPTTSNERLGNFSKKKKSIKTGIKSPRKPNVVLAKLSRKAISPSIEMNEFELVKKKSPRQSTNRRKTLKPPQSLDRQMVRPDTSPELEMPNLYD